MGEQLLSFLLNKSGKPGRQVLFFMAANEICNKLPPNIPVRFEFEKNLLSSQKERKPDRFGSPTNPWKKLGEMV